MAWRQLLDGGLSTELQRRGLHVRDPWWSTEALRTSGGRRLLREVHDDFLAAGAQVITAATFRCNLRAMSRAGLDEAAAARMVGTAVGLARSARDAVAPTDRVWVAGSIAPVEDCYRPELVPADAELRLEHSWMARQLLASRVDLVLVETMSSLREARIALEAVLAVGLDAWVSFVCAADARLLSGERLAEAAATVEREGAGAVLVNCTPPAESAVALTALRHACSGPIGVYPNLEDRSGIPERTPVDRYVPVAVGAAPFAELVERWRRQWEIDVLGGCCGCSPAHLAALRDRLGAAPAPAAPPRRATRG